MIFWGEAIGEAAPPMLEARAMPRMRAFEKRESAGRLRRRGFGGISMLKELKDLAI